MSRFGGAPALHLQPHLKRDRPIQLEQMKDMKEPVLATSPGASRRTHVLTTLLAKLPLRTERTIEQTRNLVPQLVSQTHAESHGDLLKRSIDVVGGLLLIIAFAPLMALVALVIRLESPGPIFFRQKRLGRGGRPFTMYKFRTMGVGAEAEQERLAHLNERKGPAFKIPCDPRHTRVGRWVRRMSLDELPNLLNVLKGEMSLVGPRPPLPAEVEHYEDWHKRRLQVIPGITGLWQVSGRSKLSFDEQCRLDLFYIEHWSPWLDFSIMLRTIPAVLLATGAY